MARKQVESQRSAQGAAEVAAGKRLALGLELVGRAAEQVECKPAEVPWRRKESLAAGLQRHHPGRDRNEPVAPRESLVAERAHTILRELLR